MERKKFLQIKSDSSIYDSLYKDGLLVAPKKINGKYLYVIGLDISYDTLDYKLYNIFVITTISEFDIYSVAKNIFGEIRLKQMIHHEKLDVHNILLKIFQKFGKTRYEPLVIYFGVLLKESKIKQYSGDEIAKMVDFQIPENESGYKHIDINLGIKFIDDY